MEDKPSYIMNAKRLENRNQHQLETLFCFKLKSRWKKEEIEKNRRKPTTIYWLTD